MQDKARQVKTREKGTSQEMKCGWLGSHQQEQLTRGCPAGSVELLLQLEEEALPLGAKRLHFRRAGSELRLELPDVH